MNLSNALASLRPPLESSYNRIAQNECKGEYLALCITATAPMSSFFLAPHEEYGRPPISSRRIAIRSAQRIDADRRAKSGSSRRVDCRLGSELF